MKSRFKAILIRKDGDKQIVEDVELTPGDLMEGDVTVAVSHSTVNYKDGLVPPKCITVATPNWHA